MLFVYSYRLQKAKFEVGEQNFFLRLSEKINLPIFNRNTKKNVILCHFLQLKVFRFFWNFPQLILMVYIWK